jgi:cytochrome c5
VTAGLRLMVPGEPCGRSLNWIGKDKVLNRHFLSGSSIPPAATPSKVKSRARRHTLLVAGLVFLSFARSTHAQSVLPEGPGKAVVERMCTACHGLNVVTAQRMTKQHWADQVDDMVARGAIGSDADIRQVVEYLSRNFGKGEPPAGDAKPPAVAASSVAAASPVSTAHAEGDDGHGPTTGVTFGRILDANQEPQNWLTFGGTYQSLHYSALSQVTPENASNLELKWVFQARWLDPYETTPLVVDGILYTMQGDDVVALDATNGRLFWIYKYTPVSEARLCCGRISRGLAILGDTLYMAAVDAHLIAIDAKTGHPLWDTKVAETTSGYT